jgi:hypothetical protein
VKSLAFGIIVCSADKKLYGYSLAINSRPDPPSAERSTELAGAEAGTAATTIPLVRRASSLEKSLCGRVDGVRAVANTGQAEQASRMAERLCALLHRARRRQRLSSGRTLPKKVGVRAEARELDVQAA